MSNSFATPWIIACQAPLCMGFPRLEILEWVAISFSTVSSWPRDRTCISCIGTQNLYCWATRKAHRAWKRVAHTHTYTHTHTHTPLCNCQIDGGYRNLQHSFLFPCTSSQEISSHQPNTMNPVIQNNFTYSSSLYTRDHIMCTLLYVISFIHTMPMRYILVIEHSSKLNIDCSV